MTTLTQPLYSLPDACRLLQIGETTLRKLEAQGKIKIGSIGRKRFITSAQLDVFIANISKGAAK